MSAPPHTPAPLAMDSAQRGEGPYIWRFSLYHRITHGVVVVSFFLLVITGLPLHFSEAFWAAPLMVLLGGVEMAGLPPPSDATRAYPPFDNVWMMPNSTSALKIP